MTAVSNQAFGFRVEDLERYECLLNALTNKDMSVSQVCSLCHSRENLKMCGRCNSAWYCSVAHQTDHYGEHKSFCKKQARAKQSGVNGLGSSGRTKKKKTSRHPTDFGIDPLLLDEMMRYPSDSDPPMQFQAAEGSRRTSFNDPALTTPIDSNGGGRRRSSLSNPALTTPIDSNSRLEASSTSHPRSTTASLVQVCPDFLTLEEGGFSAEWFSRVMKPVMKDLNTYGVCVVDEFLGDARAEQILSEVGDLHCQGVFHDGQVVSRNVQDQARGMVRGDKITWVTGGEPYCGSIGQLVSVVDTLMAKANKHQDAGELANYSIKWRTRAMVACYPGQGTHYVKHVDNPDGDGRCITAIYYINKDWTREDGGVLRIYPEGSDLVAEIEPRFDRMLFFWSDRRNPHEVLPANCTSRYAITLWYLDQNEREKYLSRVSQNPLNT